MRDGRRHCISYRFKEISHQMMTHCLSGVGKSLTTRRAGASSKLPLSGRGLISPLPLTSQLISGTRRHSKALNARFLMLSLNLAYSIIAYSINCRVKVRSESKTDYIHRVCCRDQTGYSCEPKLCEKS